MKKYSLLFLIFFTPMIAFAQVTDFAEALGVIQGLLNGLLPVLIAFAVAVFSWGVLKYIRASDNPEQRTEGRELMIYGIVAIFVMVSLWGLVSVIVDVFFNASDLTITGGDVPQFPTP